MLARIGVILAAGRGRRMGGAKQLAPWPSADGTKPLVAAAYDAIRPICDEMVVVLGHEAESVAAALGDRKFHQVQAKAEAPMFESIRAGLRAAREIDPAASIVLQPGDHPEVGESTLRVLTEWSRRTPTQAIIPEYGGRGGHPVLLAAKIALDLISANCPAGLGQFWSDHPELCHRVAVEDGRVVRDIDTPGELPASSQRPRS